jgi:hypothetical protein
VTLTCPACRKANETQRAPCVCARCAADLSPLWAVHTAAEQVLHEAGAALRRRDWTSALTAAGRSWSLRRTTEAAGLAFVAAAASGQTRRACVWLHRSQPADQLDPSAHDSRSVRE